MKSSKPDRRRFAIIMAGVLIGSLARQALIALGVTYGLALVAGLLVTGVSTALLFILFMKH